MANYVYGAIALTGGGFGALDGIDGADLNDQDAAIVFTATTSYMYTLDENSGASESSPDVIAPDANPGDKRWILLYKRSDDIDVDTTDFDGILTSAEDSVQKALDVLDDVFAAEDFTITSKVAYLDDDVQKTYSTDSGTVTPSAHVTTVNGAGGITVSGAADVMTITRDDLALATKAADYPMTAADDIIIGDCAGGNVKITLPAANAKDRVRIMKKSNSNTLTIERAGSDTIEGNVNIQFTDEYQSVTLVSDGTNTWIEF